MSDEYDDAEGEVTTHPRFSERRAAVQDQTLRSRNRKLLAVGAVILTILLAAASTQSALFDVDEVRIVGAERTAPSLLRELSAVELGTPILGLDTDAIEERLVTLPVVSNVRATKSWRGVVTVEIDERIPVARIESVDGVILVADDGVVIELVDQQPDGQLTNGETPDAETPDAEMPGTETPDTETPDIEPLELPADVAELIEISGAMFAADPGEQVPEVLDDALILAGQLPSDIRSITERIELTVDSLVLRVVGGGAISIGDGRDLDDKFEATRAFLAQVDLSCLKTLNVRAPTVPVIVRNSGC